mgnify:CR=1 FL=1
MKNILSILCFLIPTFLSCTKEAEYNVPKETGMTPVKNSYRAKTISGKNDHWGEFKLVLNYKNEKMDTAQLFNGKGRQIGEMTVKLNSSTNQTYSLFDFVPKIDPDSIRHLDERLSERYGPGNYVLEDSIPMSTERLFSAQLIQDKYTRETKLTRIYYGPVDDPGSGSKYIYNYRKIQQFIHAYEYDTESNLVVERTFQDIYSAEDENTYEREIRKYEYLYNVKQLTTIICYEAEAGENFNETERYRLVYNDTKLSSVQGQYLTKQFTYTGNYISLVSGDRLTYTYEHDAHGNVTKISCSDGTYLEVEYEAGHGNISQFLPFFERLMGNPYIK